MIDQEGGAISRLGKIIDFSLFSQSFFGRSFIKDKNYFYFQYKLYVDRVSFILKKIGVNINTVPVLDVLRSNSSKIIGTRSFSSNPEVVSQLGSLCIDLFEKNKIATVIKHIPGHGLAKSDSHFFLPSTNKKKEELKKIDFKPFKKCNSLFAMTAHVLFKKYDPINPATHSKIIIDNVIRKHIGFKGILI